MTRAGDSIEDLDAPPSVHAFDNTQQSDIGTSYVPGSQQVDVSFIAPSSGRVMVIVSAGMRSEGVNARISVNAEIRENDVFGSIAQFGTDVAVGGPTSDSFNTTRNQYMSRMILAPINRNGFTAVGLQPGNTYFARLLHAASTGGAGRIIRSRSLTVVPVSLGHAYSNPLGRARVLDRPPIQRASDTAEQSNITAGIASRHPGGTEVSVEFVGPNSGRALIVVGGGCRDNSSTGRIGLFPEVRIGGRNGPLLFDPEETVGGLANYFRFFWTNSSVQTSLYQFGNAIGFLGEPSTPNLIPGQRYFAKVFMVTSGGGTTDVFTRELYVVPIS